ncbi:MAG: ABC transporter permease [Geodermatophilaceae bacterium]|nr:ABC transporter permease [Geodermatophilaceae bacterium]
MSTLARWPRIVGYSAANALADFRATYSVKTWTFGWLGRVVSQVIFFALIGRLLDSPEAAAYLLVGNAVMIAALEAMMVVASTTWERRAGTLPLLIAAPSPLAPVFVGRSLQWLPSGVATALIALFVAGPLFGVTWSLGEGLVVALLVVVVAVTTYCFGLFLAALVLRAMEWRNIISNVAYLTMMAICGVMVPVSFWPSWVQGVAQALPLTHGLRAVRRVAADGVGSPIVLDCLLAIGIAALWLALAAGALRWLAEQGRRDGSIEFAS